MLYPAELRDPLLGHCSRVPRRQLIYEAQIARVNANACGPDVLPAMPKVGIVRACGPDCGLLLATRAVPLS